MTAASIVSDTLQVEVDPRKSFPSTLHRMLTQIDEISCRDPSMKHLKEIISWQEHGMSFKIHNRAKFINTVMPIWFQRLKYSSFVRQMNLYGFKRVQEEGPDKGAIYHSLFVRGMPELAANIEKAKKNSNQNETASAMNFQLVLARSQSAPSAGLTSCDVKPSPIRTGSLPSSPNHGPATSTSLHSMMMPSSGSLRDMLLPILSKKNEFNPTNTSSVEMHADSDPLGRLLRTLDDDEPLPLNSCSSWDLEPSNLFP